ncbi:methylase involved in ubiquinone/menaquinone biosynthesis [Terriglobus roseus DSM 18391]|uniref:Methylase involved in ubiquinone/menaquinone biosynthesis n=1 Tax=Terriglobus roseus (strain DSM 18391 / NRRL B-41598 / KBS 63) TaxID=926566 RepID=I3ZLS0_TERRK|nr:methyltransferase domain-containing protein [Terriglobus roseus]AFL90188.1 methylase involved in ubiquinone/menaquinone biosynthesis [Terriglobus roseus DSM 18391]
MSTMPQTTPPIEQIKKAMRASWIAGDFGVIAKTIYGSAQEFVQRLAIPSGSKVLDVATGTGNVALPLARSGCIVTGLDIAPNLLDQARERAAEVGLSIQFDEGDAEAMPYADDTFDAVTTMFGAMFAPRPDRVAAELARVLKPGGLLAMANWNPESFTGRMFRAGAKHVPPPPGVPPPVQWGDPDKARERLTPGFNNIQADLIPLNFVMDTNAAGAVNTFRTYFGPTKMAFERLDDAGKSALEADLVKLWSSANIAADPEHATLVPNTYLLVTARKR